VFQKLDTLNIAWCDRYNIILQVNCIAHLFSWYDRSVVWCMERFCLEFEVVVKMMTW